MRVPRRKPLQLGEHDIPVALVEAPRLEAEGAEPGSPAAAPRRTCFGLQQQPPPAQPQTAMVSATHSPSIISHDHSVMPYNPPIIASLESRRERFSG